MEGAYIAAPQQIGTANDAKALFLEGLIQQAYSREQ
jgi:hypothetical protein